MPDTEPKRRGGARPGPKPGSPRNVVKPLGRPRTNADLPDHLRRSQRRWTVNQDEAEAINRLLDSLRMPRRDPEEYIF